MEMLNKGERRNLLLGAVILCIILACASVSLATTKENLEQSLSVVSVEDVITKGYPINDSGETYGPDVKENVYGEPDLVFVCNEFGQEGYVKESDLNSRGAKSLDEAVNWSPQAYEVPIYLQDGKTVIGWFSVGNENN